MSVLGYIHSFTALFHRIQLLDPMMERQALSHLLDGIRVDLQGPVRMVQPKYIYDVFSLAKLHEAAFIACANNPMNSRPLYTNAMGTSKPPHAPNLATTPVWRNGGSQNSRILSTKEMEEKRAKVLCFGCDEKYTPSHRCRCKKHNLFVMKVGTGDDGNTQVEGYEARINH